MRFQMFVSCLLLLCASAGVTLATSPVPEPYAQFWQGLDEIADGHDVEAFAIWKKLAEQGNAGSQQDRREVTASATPAHRHS